MFGRFHAIHIVSRMVACLYDRIIILILLSILILTTLLLPLINLSHFFRMSTIHIILIIIHHRLATMVLGFLHFFSTCLTIILYSLLSNLDVLKSIFSSKIHSMLGQIMPLFKMQTQLHF